ncbi:hypothetical protein EDD21DRAFT_441949 [Dissophora ornata]|nr:hypothetical protein BGZ58_006695 [Dissophora ornata]KAI8603523.1 hypothetical protein EDD21DRAFT_441949 [Dissophora ornata]
MGMSSYRILKVSLWLQAGSLLVLTSLLADSNAWIGVALAAIGLCFVAIGVGAAHKKSLGYLYCYATLIGVWTLLAAAHVIILLGLFAVPEELMDPVLVMGQKLVNNDSDALKTILPAFYGAQSAAYCASLMCLVYLRLSAKEDPTLGFEIQPSKRKSGAHTLNSTRRNTDGCKRSSRMSQRFLGLGQSMVAPIDNSTGVSLLAETHEQEKHEELMSTIHEQEQEQHPSSKTQELRMSWSRNEQGVNSDDNVIYVPRGRKISQVVVTFRDDSLYDHSPERPQQAPPATESATAPTPNVIEARTARISNLSYDLGDLPFDRPGESLSDIIFKAVQPLSLNMGLKESAKTLLSKDLEVRESSESERTDGDTEAESPALSTVTTLDDPAILEHGREIELQLQLEQEPAVKDLEVAKEFEAVLSKDQSTGLERYQQQEKSTKEQLPTKQATPFPVVPVRHPSINHQSLPDNTLEWTSGSADLHQRTGEEHEDEFIPAPQPNCSNSHIENSELPPITPRRAGVNSVPLQYQQTHSNDSNDIDDNIHHHGPVSNAPPSRPIAPSLSYQFSNTRKQSTPTSLAPAFAIPTFVLHPDEDDDEPARVLTDNDIEYLTTMPPVPLRLLVQPWDEDDEDGYYDEQDCDGGEFDYHHRYTNYEEEEEDEGRMGAAEEKDEREASRGPEVQRAFDPYAFDVPINFAVDLQGLVQGNTKAGYGYI